MARIIKLIILFFIPIWMVSCSPKERKEGKATTEESSKDMVVKGIVRIIENKNENSYTANVQTNEGDTYVSFISRENLISPDNFTLIKAGSRVILSGVFSIKDKRNHLKVKEIVKSGDTPPELVIFENSFHGITIGDEISIYKQYIKKEVLKTPEGDVVIYRIKSFNNEIVGFFYPDPKNKNLVGEITVETPMAETVNKIKVGKTFLYLAEKFPFMEIHGSEIDGKTYASAKNFSYRLDVVNHKYDVDIAKIPLDTKITEIVIRKIQE